MQSYERVVYLLPLHIRVDVQACKVDVLKERLQLELLLNIALLHR